MTSVGWERLPPKGAISVFDRSWHGRVLVERVEGLASPAEWRRAYREINDFERMLSDNGTRIIKLFLHITPEVQLERFKERLEDPMKRWKLSYEDFRNRKNWAGFEEAVEDMIDHTSSAWAPWYAIPANDKKYARAAALTIIADRLADGVDLEPRPIDEDVEREAQEVFRNERHKPVLRSHEGTVRRRLRHRRRHRQPRLGVRAMQRGAFLGHER